MTDYFTKVEEWGRTKGRANDIRNLMQTMHLTMEQAMDALLIPKDEQEKCKELLMIVK